MDYVVLFLADGIMGYALQSVGYLLSVYAFSKRRIDIKQFVVVAAIFSLVMFFIRNINLINYGFHTILIMIVFILISLFFLKTQIYSTVLATLVTTVTILISEAVNVSILTIIFGAKAIEGVLEGNGTLQGDINKAIAGIPTNLLLVIVMLILYKVFTKKLGGEKADGNSRKKLI